MIRYVFAVLALTLVVASTGPASGGEPPIPIEGRLLVSRVDSPFLMEGTSDNHVPLPSEFASGDVSPVRDEVAYHVRNDAAHIDIWKAELDGTNAVNLTSMAGVGGVNCIPQWSPDGSMIAFRHCDPVAGLSPCDAGFHVWAMDADGTDAHQVTPDEVGFTVSADWGPHGYRLVCYRYYPPNPEAIAVNVDGTDVAILANVRGTPAWSPDGTQIVSSGQEDDIVDGVPGAWRRLILTKADGSDPEVLVQQFLRESDVEDSAFWAGPCHPEWSPKGDRIAFIAALPFDPQGPPVKLQDEVWVYELATGDLTRITDNDCHENALSWAGPNTFPGEPGVTVGSVTVTFSEVSGEGVTTIVRDDDPPDVPTGSVFDHAFYELSTTAEVTGPIAICMTYTDEEVPPAAQADLAILHWDGAHWVDITTSRDPVNNAICGQTDSLSPIALHGIRETRFTDVPAWGFGSDGLDPHWAYYQVMACVKARIVSGYGDGTYQPTGPVTRDQMAVFISRAMVGGDGNVPPGPTTATFEDTPTDHWAYDYVEYCVANDVVQGYDAVTYGPADVVGRDSMAVFIARAIAGDDESVPDPSGDPSFSDVSADFWSYRHIEYIAGQEVAGGYHDGLYHPEWLVTRDQMAVYICRAFELPT